MSPLARRLCAAPLVILLLLLAVAPGAAAAGDTSWFTDPLSGAARRLLVPVPADPGAYDGTPLRHTTALHRTRAGMLAVPAQQARGHQLVAGQAVTLGIPAGYPATALPAATRAQLDRLRASTARVAALTCEGYADHATPAIADGVPVTTTIAAGVCAYLRGDRPSLRTTAVGVGAARPVVVGGSSATAPSQRAANRRVVVVVDSSLGGPSAPLLDATLTHADLWFAHLCWRSPASDGGSPVTGYQASADDGPWVDLVVLSSSGGWEAMFAATAREGCVSGEQHDVRVRAVNAVAPGLPSNALTLTFTDCVPDGP